MIKENMNNRQLVIQELCEEFNMNKETNAASKKLIKSKVQQYLHNSDKITVGDLYKLEEITKWLCRYTKSSRLKAKIPYLQQTIPIPIRNDNKLYRSWIIPSNPKLSSNTNLYLQTKHQEKRSLVESQTIQFFQQKGFFA